MKLSTGKLAVRMTGCVELETDLCPSTPEARVGRAPQENELVEELVSQPSFHSEPLEASVRAGKCPKTGQIVYNKIFVLLSMRQRSEAYNTIWIC